ncbi:MAG: hypothetical protein HC837_19675, partial [Chloroflexaceae bacterium]|nr:hypothetical protein [Chloroflexaceae bacterium]
MTNRVLPCSLIQLTRRHGLVAAGYLLLTLAFTMPTLWHLSDAIGGQQQGDTLQNYWNMWWVSQSLVHLGQNPYHATYIHYPNGLSLYFHTYNFLNGLLSLPLQLCCGTAVAYNGMNIFAFSMAGLGAYALSLWMLRGRAVPRRAIAFVAGMVYAFSPYMAFHYAIGQPFMVSIEWFPWYLLTLLVGLKRGRWYLVGAAVLLVMIGLTDWHYVIYALLLTALVGLLHTFAQRGWPAWRTLLRRLSVVGLLFALGMAPVVVPMILELSQEAYAVRDIRHSLYHSTDLLAFVLPSIYHRSGVIGPASCFMAIWCRAVSPAAWPRWASFRCCWLLGIYLPLGSFCVSGWADLAAGGRPRLGYRHFEHNPQQRPSWSGLSGSKPDEFWHRLGRFPGHAADWAAAALCPTLAVAHLLAA